MKKELKTDRLQIPITGTEKARIEKAAEMADMSVSQWVRFVLKQRLNGGTTVK